MRCLAGDAIELRGLEILVVRYQAQTLPIDDRPIVLKGRDDSQHFEVTGNIRIPNRKIRSGLTTLPLTTPGRPLTTLSHPMS